MRRHIGMVFQQPNPFAMSIFRNVAFGLRLNRYKGAVEDKVEPALRRPRCGTRSRTSFARAVWRSREDSSSGCASRGRSPPSPRCC